MAFLENLRFFDLDKDRTCVLNVQGPSWIVISRQEAARLRHWQDSGGLALFEVTALEARLTELEHRVPPPVTPTKPPMELYIELLNACNLKCVHCYNRSGDTSRPKYELPFELLLNLLDEAASMGAASITFSGGEPLLRRDIFDLLVAARERHLPTKVITNGVLITPKIAEQLVASSARIDISLEGASATTHDYIRGEGSFVETMKGLDNLINAGGVEHLSCSVVLNRMNRHELASMVDLCQKYQAKRLQLIFPAYQGRAVNVWDNLCMPRRELGELCIEIFDLKQSLTGKLEIENEIVSTAIATLLFGGEANRFSCSVCSQLRVDYEGNVHPCAFFSTSKYQYGNLLSAGSLRAVLQQASPVVREIEEALFCRADRVQQVAKCSWRGYCGGGCMADATHRDDTVWGVGNLCCDIRQNLYLHIIRRMTSAGEVCHASI